MLIYGNTSPAFLLRTMFPDAEAMRMRVGESGDDVLGRASRPFDTFAFHVNLTDSARVPLDRERFVSSLEASGRVVVNRGITDISKSGLHERCRLAGLRVTAAERDGPQDELLIVKTDFNCGGAGERQLNRTECASIGIPYRDYSFYKGGSSYAILSRSDLDDALWGDGDYVIDTFVENSRDWFYRCYVYGDHLVVSRAVDPEPLKRMPTGTVRSDFSFTLGGGVPTGLYRTPTDVVDVARDVAALIHTSGIDFAAIDVVADESGAPYVVDINLTPVWGDTGLSDIVAFLAEGSIAR